MPGPDSKPLFKISHAGGSHWLVTFSAPPASQHRVSISPEDLARFAPSGTETSALLQASFEFLLEREPHTAILSSFDLPVIADYFPDYPSEIRRRLKGV